MDSRHSGARSILQLAGSAEDWGARFVGYGHSTVNFIGKLGAYLSRSRDSIGCQKLQLRTSGEFSGCFAGDIKQLDIWANLARYFIQSRSRPIVRRKMGALVLVAVCALLMSQPAQAQFETRATALSTGPDVLVVGDSIAKAFRMPQS